MQFTHLQRPLQRKRPAAALTVLIIVIALAFVVYFVQWYLRKTVKDPDVCYDLSPWKEWELRETSEKPRGEPSEKQPAITEAIEFDTNAELLGEHRGEIGLTVYPDGTVLGSWYGQYYKKPNINFDIQGGGFEGYVCPLKIYRDEDDEDPSKLYFITKGKFMIHETDFEKDKFHIRGGDIYVTGWLDTDYSVTGEITITSDEKYFETFNWKVVPLREK